MTDSWSFKMKIFAITIVSFLPVAAIAQAARNQAPDRTWITNVNIVSPQKLGHIEKGSVLIESGRIVSVQRRKGAKEPAGATVVSGEGQFLVPGHLASVPGMRPEVNFGPAEAKPASIKEYLKQLPRSYLYFGHTTLVDLAVIDRRVLDDFRQAPLHPDLYDCGESLPFANGYPMSFAPPETRFRPFPNLSTTLTKPPAFPLKPMEIFPGLNGYLEIQQLQKAGLSLKQILRAAKLNNARLEGKPITSGHCAGWRSCGMPPQVRQKATSWTFWQP